MKRDPMIIPVSELVERAKSHCDCMDPVAAKMFYDRHEGTVIIDVREPGETEESKLNDSSNIPRGLLEMKIANVCPEEKHPDIAALCCWWPRFPISPYIRNDGLF